MRIVRSVVVSPYLPLNLSFSVSISIHIYLSCLTLSLGGAKAYVPESLSVGGGGEIERL